MNCGSVKTRLHGLFTRPSVAASIAAFLDTLSGPERRSTLAEPRRHEHRCRQ